MPSSKPSSAPVAMDTGNPWEDPTTSTTTTTSSTNEDPSASSSSDKDAAKDASIGVSASSTPPDGGWADFGAFKDEEQNKDQAEMDNTGKK